MLVTSQTTSSDQLARWRRDAAARAHTSPVPHKAVDDTDSRLLLLTKAKEILARMLDQVDKKLECGSLERTAEAVVQHLRRMQGPAEQSDRAPGASSPPVVVSEM